jgi:type IV secretory pathway TrbL component
VDDHQEKLAAEFLVPVNEFVEDGVWETCSPILLASLSEINLRNHQLLLPFFKWYNFVAIQHNITDIAAAAIVVAFVLAGAQELLWPTTDTLDICWSLLCLATVVAVYATLLATSVDIWWRSLRKKLVPASFIRDMLKKETRQQAQE